METPYEGLIECLQLEVYLRSENNGRFIAATVRYDGNL